MLHLRGLHATAPTGSSDRGSVEMRILDDPEAVAERVDHRRDPDTPAYVLDRLQRRRTEFDQARIRHLGIRNTP